MLNGPMESNRAPGAAKSAVPAPRSPNVVRPGEAGFFARHGNTILTGVLVAAAIVLAVRWWVNSAANARQQVMVELNAARQSVDQLRGPRVAQLPPDQLVSQSKVIRATATAAVDDVLAKADDASVKARALLVRGDLCWTLANLPEAPGATTQPSLRPDVPADQMLRQASDAYAAVIDLTGAEPLSVAAAHLSLAAVAENRGDWAAATSHLKAVADNADPAVAVLSSAAQAQLAEVPLIQTPAYLAPPTTAPTAVVPPPVAPPVVPAGPMGPAKPTTVPTSQPAK